MWSSSRLELKISCLEEEQEAGGRRQEAGGRRQEISYLNGGVFAISLVSNRFGRAELHISLKSV